MQLSQNMAIFLSWIGATVSSLLLVFFSSVCIASNENTEEPIISWSKSYSLKTLTLGSEAFNREKEKYLKKTRQSMIETIQQVLEKTPEGDQKGQLMVRLARLYVEDYYAELAAIEAIRKINPKEKVDTSIADNSLKKAIPLYEALLPKYPNLPQRDEILYLLGIFNLDNGHEKKALRYFSDLTKRYPNSKYLDEADLFLGDHYFEKNQLPKADSHFERVISRGKSELLPYAVYKKAWCSYNLGNPAVALEKFKWVIQFQQKNPETKIKLLEEALRDIALPFVDLNQLEQSIAFFKSFGGVRYRAGLQSMANLYSAKGKRLAAISLWTKIVESDPQNPINPEFDLKITENYMLERELFKSISHMFSSLTKYLPDSDWASFQSQNNPALIEQTQREYEAASRRYAFHYHYEAQKTKEKNRYDVAKGLYQNYLKFFPNSEHIATIRFYLAEILYKQGDYLPAAETYFQVYQDPRATTLKLESLRSALYSLDHLLKLELLREQMASRTNSSIREQSDSSTQKTSLSAPELRFLEFSEEYIRSFPNEKEITELIYERGILMYLHGDHEGAEVEFQIFLKTRFHPIYSYSMAHLLLDFKNRANDYQGLLKLSREFLNNPKLSNPKFRSEIKDISRKAALKRAQVLETKGKYLRAAKRYLEYGKTYGTEDLSLYEKSMYNAIINFAKAGKMKEAIQLQEQFVNTFPKSPLREALLLQIGKHYESIPDYKMAAEYYSRFALDFPSNGQAQRALRLAGLYFWGASQFGQAEQMFLLYLNRKLPDSSLVESDLLDLYATTGEIQKQIVLHKKIASSLGVAPDRILFSQMQVLKLRTHPKKTPQKLELQKIEQFIIKNQTALKKTQRGKDLMAEVELLSARNLENSFYSVPISTSNKPVHEQLKAKLTAMKNLESLFERIASIGSVEGSFAATYKVARAYLHLASEMKKTPMPRNLASEALEIYRAELNKTMISPTVEKAKSYVSRCLDKSREVLTQWSARCYQLATQLDPDHYPIVRTFYIPSVFIAGLSDDSSKGPDSELFFPYYSGEIFKPLTHENSLPSQLDFAIENRDDTAKSLAEPPSIFPLRITYESLANERLQQLKTKLKEFESSNPQVQSPEALTASLSIKPSETLPAIRVWIHKNPKQFNPHNVLSVAYLTAGNLPAAKITLLKMHSEGVQDAILMNNLGVLSKLEGKNEVSIAYFVAGTKLSPSVSEAFGNLGFVALRYRNGALAKKYFKRAVALSPKNTPFLFGLSTALIQNGEYKEAKALLLSTINQAPLDPIAHLALAYFLLDIEKNSEAASQLLTKYVSQNGTRDTYIQLALQSLRKSAAVKAKDKMIND